MYMAWSVNYYCVHASPPMLLRCLHLRSELFAFTCFFGLKRLGLALPFSLCVGCLFAELPKDFGTSLRFDRPTTQTTAHRYSPRADYELVCLVPAREPFTACALLEFAKAPIHILKVLDSVDIGINTATSPGLEIAALCLSLWPARQSFICSQ